MQILVRRLLCCSLLVFLSFFADGICEKIQYFLSLEPIDVVIPCAAKDVETLDLCISGIKKNGRNIRNIFVISPERLTYNAGWFDEKNYPFTQFDIALEIFQDESAAWAYLASPQSRIGWIYQQLLKLYAPLIIPNISSNVLVLDADTIFLNPVSFQGPSGEGLYNPGWEYTYTYFEHAQRLIPWFRKIFANFSGISHHMLFQRPVIDDLFSTIESYHQVEPWKALCRCISQKDIFVALSEFEIYFNFVFARSDQMRVRQLRWENITSLKAIHKYRKAGYHYVSCHHYARKD
jgi:hypothetical protein